MPGKKQSKPPEPPWQLVLERLETIEERIDRGIESTRAFVEDIRSDNRTTIEAVEAARVALEQRFERLDHDSRGRDATLELAIRDLRVNVQQNSVDIRQLQGDVQGLAAKVEAQARIEERVAALEKRLA
jgi:hypothetical protein